MSAPFLWIIAPILVGSLSLLLLSRRAVAITGGTAFLVLSAVAAFVPFDQALRVGPLSFKVTSSADLLGRSITLAPAGAPLLAMVFGICALWFFGAEAAGVAGRLIPLGCYVVALLVTSIAVQPFLFAALLIEAAVLVGVPLLAPPGETPSRGVLRFLIYQTLGMPFILFSGWLLVGVESSAGDLALTVQSTAMLALGFAFLLAVFPFSDWIPRIMQECHPYAAGFLVWLLPNFIVVFAMSFLDRYTWLRASPQVVGGLLGVGLLMLVGGGVWAAFEDHLGRIFAFAAIAETGFLLISMSQAAGGNADLVFAFLIPRGLALTAWAFALSILRADGVDLRLMGARGSAWTHPWASAVLVAAGLSTAGFPLLAGFPPKIALWSDLARVSIPAAAWFLVGLIGLTVAVSRQFAALIIPGGARRESAREGVEARAMLGTAAAVLLILGLFPQSVGFIIRGLPLMFQHLGR